MSDDEKKDYPETGRPSDYTQELGLKICDAIARSEKGLNLLYKKHDWMPHPSTVYRWIESNEEFRDRYARARDEQADFLAEQIVKISDEALIGEKVRTKDGKKDITVGDNVERSKLMVDARKWVAARLAPKKYGQRVDVTTDGQKINNGAFPVPQEVFDKVSTDVHNGVQEDSSTKKEA